MEETVSNDILLRDVKFWYCGKCYCEKLSTKVDLKLMIKNGKLTVDPVRSLRSLRGRQ